MTLNAGSPKSAEEELQNILAAAGLESSPIDPSSMMTLKQMIMNRRRNTNDNKFTSPESSVQNSGGNSVARETPGRDQLMSTSSSTTTAGGYDNIPMTVARDKPNKVESSKTMIGTGKSVIIPPGDHNDTTNSSTQVTTLSADSTTPSNIAQTPSTTVTTTSNGSLLDGSSSSDVLRQLKLQTTLLLDLQQKVEMLTAKVDSLEGSYEVDSTRSNVRRTNRPKRSQRDRDTEGGVGTGDHTGFDRTTQHQQGQDEPNGREQQQQQRVAGNNDNNGNGLIDVILFFVPSPFRWMIRLMFTCARFQVRMLVEFYSKVRAEMRPIDGGIIFQLIFVAMVFSSRIDPAKNPEKFAVLAFVISVGLLYQLKFWEVFYNFFIKNQDPERIWRELNGGNNANPAAPNVGGPGPVRDERAGPQNMGEQGGNAEQGGEGGNPPNVGGLNVDNPNHPHVVPPQRQNGGNAPGGWRNMFLLGGIYQRQVNGEDAAAPRNPILGMLWDIIYLFGSLVLSIFPMWNPQARGGLGPAPAPVVNAAPENGPNRMEPANDGGNDDDVEEEDIGEDDGDEQ